MMKTGPVLVLCAFATASFAESERQLDAHEHGVAEMNMAIEGNTVFMELHAPGADIVGFEYEAETAADRAAIEAAVAALARPMDLFVLPKAARCTVVSAKAALEHEAAHSSDHDDHDDHADHDEHDDDHAEAEADTGHAEFHAEYTLNCADPAAITTIEFRYFDVFEPAREVELQLVGPAGARLFEIERDSPLLDLNGVL